MSMKNIFFLFSVLFLFSCNQDDDLIDSDDIQASEISQHVLDHSNPLEECPLEWKDDELAFLDDYEDLKILGLGEATHGTKEFFQAKDRIMRYMVEHHGFRIFGIEADFGESIYLNEAVLASDRSSIREIMKERMHFWTWETEEVFDMLIWMCDYNEGKAEEDKVQYVGVDCQYNTYNPRFLLEYFTKYSKKLEGEWVDLMGFLLRGTQHGYDDLDLVTYEERRMDLAEFLISFRAEKPNLVELGSLSEYLFAERLLRLCEQVLEVEYSWSNSDIPNRRDTYMGENALWYVQDFFPDGKMLMWQHNFHVGRLQFFGPDGSMGQVMHQKLNDQYQVIGFSFSKGGFKAVQQSAGFNLGLKRLSITDRPPAQSLNGYFFGTNEPAFVVKTEDLLKNQALFSKLNLGIDMLNIGSVYNGNSSNYYSEVKDEYWDVFIHFQETSAAESLE